jgi:hypothetical protein
MSLSTVRAAIDQWDIPTDGNSVRIPETGYRTLPGGFGVQDEYVQQPKVSISKKSLMTEHGSRFTKASLCVQWARITSTFATDAVPSKITATAKVESDNKKGKRKRARETAKGKGGHQSNEKVDTKLTKGDGRSLESIFCEDFFSKMSPPSYVMAPSKKLEGLKLPLDPYSCALAVKDQVISQLMRVNCKQAYTDHRDIDKCATRTSNHYTNLTHAETGENLPSPISCRNEQFLCPKNSNFLCAHEICWRVCTSRSTVTTSTGGTYLRCNSYATKCRTEYKDNVCLEEVIPVTTLDTIMRTCAKEAFATQTTCCTYSNMQVGVEATATEKEIDNAKFLDF